ncbi:hypothetical protein X777_03361 [Ooceraea biroi]|uniref:Uncharacterized protein n=1 Tax=Ooceraea biroi TaxID=2015173 RepID=A0A026X214_OOCBI|nr:hypothetical protein X777_03361 [Ooceraea biroi]
MEMVTHRGVQQFPVLVDALEELSTEELDAHYRKNKPEHETDEEHVEYTRNRIHQRVHYDLRAGKKNPLSDIYIYIYQRSNVRGYCVPARVSNRYFRGYDSFIYAIFTLMPCHLEIALSGLRARSVLSDRNTLRFSFSSIKRLNMDTCPGGGVI